MRRLPFFVLALALLPSCSVLGLDDDDPRDRLASARARWAALGYDDYVFRLKRGWCECLPESLHPLRIHVRDGAIIEVIDLETDTSVEPGRARTVADLFALVERLIDEDAYQLTVEYHPDQGYPASIVWDEDRQVADDEGSYTASDLVGER